MEVEVQLPLRLNRSTPQTTSPTPSPTVPLPQRRRGEDDAVNQLAPFSCMARVAFFSARANVQLGDFGSRGTILPKKGQSLLLCTTTNRPLVKSGMDQCREVQAAVTYRL